MLIVSHMLIDAYCIALRHPHERAHFPVRGAPQNRGADLLRFRGGVPHARPGDFAFAYDEEKDLF
jgi:hypothetical protein